MWVCTQGRRSLCLFWRETQTKSLSSRSPARPEVDEEKEVREKRELWVDKGTQRGPSTAESRRDQSAWDSCPGEGRSAEGGSEGRQSKIRWYSNWLLSKFREKYTPTIIYKCTKSCTKSSHKTPFLALAADLSPHCSFVLFLPVSRFYFMWP